MAEEFKALTHINVPFVELRYEPGKTIPLDVFEEAADLAAKLILVPPDGTPVPTAEEMIQHLIDGGSLSDDMDAELHPDHIVPDPNQLSLTSTIAQAQLLAEQLRAAGKSVPRELTAFINMDEHKVETADAVRGVDEVGQ